MLKNLQFLFILIALGACKRSIKEQSDQLYSRHLQQHVDLTIISTSVPDDKSAMNLLIFINGKDLPQMAAKKIIDSLQNKKMIQPLLLVGVMNNDKEDYGISSLANTPNGGKSSAKFSDFVIDELLPFIKKKTAIRKFNSIATCGSSRAGMSAFDIAWQNADKIHKVGIFSGNFYSPNMEAPVAKSNVILESIRASRKRPKLQYWFYAADNKDSIINMDTEELIGIINKKNTSAASDIQFVSDPSGNNDINSWRNHFADFLLWAFAK